MLLDERKFYHNISIAVPTPAATMFVFIIEDDLGKPIKIMIEAGKCGSEIAAQTNVIAEMATTILQNPRGFEDLLEMLSSVTTSSVRITNGIPVRSCPDGLFVALLKYKQAKHNEIEAFVGNKDYKPTNWRFDKE